MNVRRRCHLKAISENLELGLIGGVLASGIDSFWVVMDMIHNGVHTHYIVILTTLVISTYILSVALIRHHKNNVRQQIGIVYISKKEIVKAKNRHLRRVA